MPLAGEVARVSRREADEVRVADRSVHGYQAAIERTGDEAFVIKDTSGQGGQRRSHRWRGQG
jgi:hypothetical protein